VPVLTTSAVTYTAERGFTLVGESEALWTVILAIGAAPWATVEAPPWLHLLTDCCSGLSAITGPCIRAIEPVPNANIRTINTEKYLQATGFTFPLLY
jgi:hypothetical protein